jgi:hypothetical protein
MRWVSEEPARRRRGKALMEEFPTYVVEVNIERQFLSHSEAASGTCSRHGMQHARSPHNETHSWPPRQIPICRCCIRACLFIAECNESDPELDAFFGDLDDGNTDETEDYSHLEGM